VAQVGVDGVELVLGETAAVTIYEVSLPLWRGCWVVVGAAARQPQMIDTGIAHLGFRCIVRPR
jgi:hypothetical protein